MLRSTGGWRMRMPGHRLRIEPRGGERAIDPGAFGRRHLLAQRRQAQRAAEGDVVGDDVDAVAVGEEHERRHVALERELGHAAASRPR